MRRHCVIWKLTWCALATAGAAPGTPPALAIHGVAAPATSVKAEQVKRRLGDGSE
jgi:hypothetical protein